MSHTLPENHILHNKYRIFSVIGQGGFGISYKALATGLDKLVCIKELYLGGASTRGVNSTVYTPDHEETNFDYFKKRFIEEAKELAKFNHPCIVRVNDVFEENNTAYFVMDFIDGETLKSIITLNGRLAPEVALPLMTGLLEAVKTVHKSGLLHRDIKPDNVIIDKNNNAVLIDFGSARNFSESKTSSQTAILTPGYAPIEQYSDRARRGAFSDIYSLGATLYYLLTGQKPIPATDRNLEVMKAPHQLYSDIPVTLSSAVMLAMNVKPEDRFQSVEEFQKALFEGMVQKERKVVDTFQSNEKNVAAYVAPKKSKKKLVITVALISVAAFVAVFLAKGIFGQSSVQIKLIPVKVGDSYEYIDLTGKVAINPQFSEATAFRDGIALVKSSGEKGKWGYIGEDGNYLISPQYTDAAAFSEGLAWVVTEKGYPNCIGKNGMVQFSLQNAESAYMFSCGLAAFKAYDLKGVIKYAFVNNKGVVQSWSTSNINGQEDGNYSDVDHFVNGVCAVQKQINDTLYYWGLINDKGTEISGFGYSKLTNVNGEFVIEDKDGKMGIMNSKGKVVISPQYESICPDKNLYAIKQDGKYGWVNENNKTIINPQFEDAECFLGADFAVVKSAGKWGVIDKSGKLILSPQYDKAYPAINNNYIIVKSGEKYGMIDKLGKFIVNPQFDLISDDLIYSQYFGNSLSVQSHVNSEYFDVQSLVQKLKVDELNGNSFQTTVSALMIKYNVQESDFNDNGYKALFKLNRVNGSAYYDFYANGVWQESYYETVDQGFYSEDQLRYRYNPNANATDYGYDIYLNKNGVGKRDELRTELGTYLTSKGYSSSTENNSVYYYNSANKITFRDYSDNAERLTVFVTRNL